MEGNMARKPNYAFERNKRAKAKAAKREAKRQAKLAAKAGKAGATPAGETGADPTAPAPIPDLPKGRPEPGT